MIIPIICGPTGSGKTAFAIDIAKHNNIEIINADSRQIYKYFNIGTNKGSIKHTGRSISMSGYRIDQVRLEGKVNGWLFDFLEPFDEFNVMKFYEITNYLIDIITKKGVLPVIVGGTGLYIDSLIRNYNFSIAPDSGLRKILAEKTVQELQNILKKEGFNLQSLNNSDLNNKVRLIRLCEKQSIQPKNNINNTSIPYKYKLLYARIERNTLMDKINKRVDIMFGNGFLGEVESLLKIEFRDTRPMNGIGYNQVVEYIDGKLSFDQMIVKIKQSHRNYAKRQITWFEGTGRGYNLYPLSAWVDML